MAGWGAMPAYVGWRWGSVPWVASHWSRRNLVVVAVALWASYPRARIVEAQGWQTVAAPLEMLGANWIGVLFLLLSALLVADLVTLGGWLLPKTAPALRGWTALIAILLAAVGVVQAVRPPIIRDHEVQLPGLPGQRDGVVAVAISDLHLGTLTGRRLIERLIQRVNDMRPDLVLLVGDILEGNDDRVQTEIIPSLAKLRAPLGV